MRQKFYVYWIVKKEWTSRDVDGGHATAVVDI